MQLVSVGAAVALALAWTGSAFADDPPAPASAPTAAPDSGPHDICADRPTKSNGPCTVDKGRWQIESDILNLTSFRLDGVTTVTTLVTSPVVKYGLTDHSDIELGFTPDEIVRLTDHATGQSATLSGFGDMNLRWKYEFIPTGNFTATIAPFVKAPTARLGIGNGKWEGGALAPLGWNNVGGGWSLGIDPEVDYVHDALGSGYHIAVQSPFTFGRQMGKFTGFIEFWTLTDFDPAHTTHQYTADLAGAWLVNTNLQLDGGVNFGLNRETPQVQGYIGISRRF